MLTKIEFKDAMAAYRRRSGKAGIVLVGGMILLLFLGAMLQGEILAILQRHMTVDHSDTVLAVLVFGTFVLMIAGMWIMEWRLLRAPSLRCPHCRKPLPHNSAITIATGNCGHCGGRVLANDAAVTDPAEHITLDELRKADKLFCRHVNRRFALAGGIALGCVIVGGSTMRFAGPWLLHEFGNVTGELVRGFVMIPGVLVAGYIFWSAVRLRPGPGSPTCPSCGACLVEHTQLVTASRCCHKCGQRVMIEPAEKLLS